MQKIKLTKSTKERFAFLLTMFFLTYFIWEVDAKFGFMPRDEARVLGMVQRISNGQIPHRDFMYQTLIGSPYLHIFHLLVPTMVMQFQRIISILMFQVYSLALLNLSDKFKESSITLKILFFIISSILNMHYFEFTIWPTVDGIFLLSIGAFLIFKSNKYQTAGFFIIGLAPLMKTPFYFSVFFMIIFSTLVIRKFNTKHFIRASLTAGLPTLTYILFISINGGLTNLIEETLGQPSNSFELINSWIHHLGFYEKILLPTSLLLVLIFTYKPKNGKSLKINLLLLLIFGVIVNSLDFGSMNYKPIINLLNLFFIIVYFFKHLDREFPDTFTPFFVCYAIEFSAIMSIGWRWGLFVSGTVLILILISILDVDLLESKINIYFNQRFTSKILEIYLIPLLVTLIFINPVINLISHNSYTTLVDKPKEELTFNLNKLNSQYGNIYTSENVYKYLESIEFCLDRYETKKVSIFPDNPALYFVYDLENPIPVDWYDLGVSGKVSYDDERIQKQMLSSDYKGSIIMLQSYKVSRLPSIETRLINVVIENPFPEYLQPIYKDIYSYLKNRENTSVEYCNSFTVLINN